MTSLSWICLILNLFVFTSVLGQEEDDPTWELTGYISDMMSMDWSQDTLGVDNLLHNRLNFKWFPNNHFNLYIDARSRVFLGKSVKTIPQFREAVDLQNDYLDLSIQFPDNGNWMFHTMLDRAYIEWYKDDWEIRLGRQRINWGVDLVWNPNDLFNAFSFFDFDYIERPGSDALRIKKYIGHASSLEFAINAVDDLEDLVVANMYRWNKRNYDFQLVSGKAKKDLVLGFAWAGNIKQAGFKGEATFFYPYKDRLIENAVLVGVVSGDYVFRSSLYLHAGVLYNSNGSNEMANGILQFSTSIVPTARNLSPFPWSIFLQSTYQFHPLITGGIANIYFPGKRNAIFINPSISYSVGENLDVSFIAQFYFDNLVNTYKAYGKLIYLRAKWSF